jgi:RecQ mediated genome instability protein
MTISSNNSSNDHETTSVMDELRQVAGVVPSSEWWNVCYSELQSRSQTATFEMVLEQILFHDVRDVVRTMNSDENQNTSEADMPPNVILLRNAMDESRMNDGRQQELPSSFRLLLQVEEICDVSKNSESRLSNDTSSAGTCRKFCCVDGHLPPQPLMAVEVSPILPGGPWPPGTKVLLTGPMTVRHGILGWHAGNVLVLGGHVERLVHLQERERQQRIQASGHGIDPTIRALIWKQNDEHLRNEEEDEGTNVIWIVTALCSLIVQLTRLFLVIQKDEHASSDVVELPPRSHGTSPPVHRIQATITQSNARSSPRPEPQPLRSAVPTQPTGPSTTTVPNRYAAASRTTVQNVVPPSVSPRSEPPPVSFPPATSASLLRNRYAAPAHLRTAALASAEMTTVDNIPVGPCRSEVLTLVQLRTFLHRVLQDEAEYRQQCHRSFLVGPVQQVGPKLYFNISKRKKDGTVNSASHDKVCVLISETLWRVRPLFTNCSYIILQQYEYVEYAKFGHGSENDGGLVTCRVSNAILEPCFSLSAVRLACPLVDAVLFLSTHSVSFRFVSKDGNEETYTQ